MFLVEDVSLPKCHVSKFNFKSYHYVVLPEKEFKLVVGKGNSLKISSKRFFDGISDVPVINDFTTDKETSESMPFSNDWFDRLSFIISLFLFFFRKFKRPIRNISKYN